MKRVLEIVFALLLTCFSFYYTSKVVDFSKNRDPIMMSIKENIKTYEVSATNAIINDNYIIPGISGVSIDINKSYEKMKKLGEYNSNLLILNSIIPDVSINNYYDKYISSGSDSKRMITLIFTVNSLEEYNNLLNISKKNNAKLTIFLDGTFINKNFNYIKDKIKDFNIENNGYNSSYSVSKLKYTNRLIKNLTSSKGNYCLLLNEDDSILDICSLEKMHTIVPLYLECVEPFKQLKESIKQGGIYYFEYCKKSIDQLSSTINFIKQQGYEIVSLDDLLSE